MTNPKNQNILLLPEVTATRAARIAAAHARHYIPTYGTWTAVQATKGNPATVRPPVYRQTPEQLQQTAEAVTRFVLRAREQASGLDLFRQLAQQAGNDSRHARLATLANEAAEARAKADKTRRTADNLRAYAKRKDTIYTEAKEAREAAERLTKQADHLSKHAADLESIIHTATASDRADIVQAAILGALTHDHAAAPDEAFRAMCTAAGRGIGAIASPSALTANRTKVNEISPEEAAALIQRYGADTKIPHTVRGCTSQCFDTVELRTRGRGDERRPTWCKVSHYLTTAPYISYEEYTEATGGDTAEIATNGGINAIGTQQDAADIADLLTRANLTAREQAIVYKVADQTAARHGQAAAAEYWEKRTPEIEAMKSRKERNKAHKAAQETADRERIAAQWENALDRSNIYSKANRKTVKSRIRSKLTEAMQNPEPLTKAEQEERTARQWEAMQRNSRRGNPTAEATAPDIIGAVQAHAATVPEAAPVIRWTESGTAPEATNPGEDIRTAAVYARDEYRQSAPKATPPELTPREAREAARLAARVADLESLIARYEAAKEAMTKADTRSPEARAEAERMRAAAADLKPVKTR